MNLTVIIESAEHKYMQILEEFFIGVYDEKSLPSHGIEHHRRVWSYSKELLSLYDHFKPENLLQLPAKLIIASYLHDSGMSVEKGIRHGKHSRDLCIRFLNNNHLNENDFPDVLETIENHDRKDYPGNSEINDLLTILSVADDLDAFGFIGIYRYSEIYLTRGINPQEIGYLIKVNAGMRFDNFIKTFGFADSLISKHIIRYKILDDFFSEYNKQVKDYKFGGEYPSGYCGVLEILIDVVNNKIILEDILKTPGKFSTGQIIHWFFNGLANELLTQL
jgi:hypothetical protein